MAEHEIQVTITPEDGDNITVTITTLSTVLELKETIVSQSDNIYKTPDEFELKFNDTFLSDSTTLGPAGVGNGANLHLIQLQKDGSSSSNSDEKVEESEKEADSLSVLLNEDEVPRSILVENLPLVNQEETENQLVTGFSQFGSILRLIVQSDEGEGQRALIIYTEESEAASALQHDFSNDEFFGNNTTIRSVSEVVATERSESKQNNIPARASGIIAGILASGYIAGSRGVAWMKTYDEKYSISQKTKEKVGSAIQYIKVQSEQRGISEKIGHYTTIVGNKASEIDERYQIVGTLKKAVDKTTTTISNATKKAMEDERVKSGVESVGKAFNSISNWAGQTYESAKKKVEEKK